MKWENGFYQVLRNNILTFASRYDGMACYKPVLLMRITRTAEFKKNLLKDIRVSLKPLGLDSPRSWSEEKLIDLGQHSMHCFLLEGIC